MYKILALLFVFSCLTACRELSDKTTMSEDIETQTPPPAHPTEIGMTEDWTEYRSRTVSLAIKVPTGWISYNTDEGIVLNERAASIADGVALQGILVHIFTPPIDAFHIPDTQDENMAWAILRQVVANPDYVGHALVHEPVAFQWDRYDAAYYLLNNLDGTVTILIALELPDRKNLVVCHISSSRDDAERVRDLLPELFDSLTINETLVDSSALDTLPDPLVFPLVSTISEFG